jgi:hypothetical protein
MGNDRYGMMDIGMDDSSIPGRYTYRCNMMDTDKDRYKMMATGRDRNSRGSPRGR